MSYRLWQGYVRGRPGDGWRDAHDRGPSVHRGRHHRARVLRRNAARRSARSVDSAASGAPDRRRHVDAAAADLRVAARDRPHQPGRDDRRHRPAAHRHPPAVAAARLGLSGQLDARRHAVAAESGDHRRAGGRRRRHHEGAVPPQPAHPARRVRAGAADRLRQRREPAARARGGAARSDGAAAGDRRVAPADRHAGADRERSARRRRRRGRTRRRDRHGAHAVVARVRRHDLPADRHDAVADGAGVRVRAGARHRHRVRRGAGVVRDAHRSDRRAPRRGPHAPAITARSRARRCSCCRRRCPSCWSRAR